MFQGIRNRMFQFLHFPWLLFKMQSASVSSSRGARLIVFVVISAGRDLRQKRPASVEPPLPRINPRVVSVNAQTTDTYGAYLMSMYKS